MWTSTVWLTLTACLLPPTAPVTPVVATATEPSSAPPRNEPHNGPQEVTFVPREGRACITCPWPQLAGWPALAPRDPSTTIYTGDDGRGKPQLYTDGWSRTQPTFAGLTVDYARRAAPYWGYPDVTVQPDVHFRADCHEGEVCRWATPTRGHIVLFVNPDIAVTVPE